MPPVARATHMQSPTRGTIYPSSLSEKWWCREIELEVLTRLTPMIPSGEVLRLWAKSASDPRQHQAAKRRRFLLFGVCVGSQ
jgi:hypothetical protein